MRGFVLFVLLVAACTNVSAVRLQPETIDVGPGMRPVAGIQANASSFYLLFVPIPGDVNLDHVVNRLLVVAAKTMGADEITQLHFHVDSCQPSLCFWHFLGVQTAEASGIAVQIRCRRWIRTPTRGPSRRRGPGLLRRRAALSAAASSLGRSPTGAARRSASPAEQAARDQLARQRHVQIGRAGDGGARVSGRRGGLAARVTARMAS